MICNPCRYRCLDETDPTVYHMRWLSDLWNVTAEATAEHIIADVLLHVRRIEYDGQGWHLRVGEYDVMYHDSAVPRNLDAHSGDSG